VKAPGWLADVVAGLIVLVYVGVCVWLIATGKGNPDDWAEGIGYLSVLTIEILCRAPKDRFAVVGEEPSQPDRVAVGCDARGKTAVH
jgi:hypothetical protein